MLFSSQLPLRRMVLLCRSLAVAYDAGIPLKRCFPLACERNKSVKMRRIMAAVSDGITRGLTLDQALRTQSKYFPPLFVEALGVAEVSGSLAETLRYLADYYEEWLGLRRQLQRQMTYPLAVFGVIWLFLPILEAYLRQAAGLYNDSNIRAFWIEHGTSILHTVLRFGAYLVALAVLARAGILRLFADFVSLYVWPIAPMMKRLNLALFFRSMAVLLNAGLSVPEAVERSANVVPNRLLRKWLQRPIALLQSGADLAEAFAPVPALSLTARQMLAIGEQTGTLPETLLRTSQYLHAEGMHPLYVLVSLVEATLILGVALFAIGRIGI